MGNNYGRSPLTTAWEIWVRLRQIDEFMLMWTERQAAEQEAAEQARQIDQLMMTATGNDCGNSMPPIEALNADAP